MKAVIQRVNKAKLICGDFSSEIKKGLVVYFGVAKGDKNENVIKIAKKIAEMRIFKDENDKMNLSIKDIGGEILAVSQFTLLADCSRGNRPGFDNAENPIRANELYQKFINELILHGLTVKTGVFGGDMTIYQENQGPVTIIYEI